MYKVLGLSTVDGEPIRVNQTVGSFEEALSLARLMHSARIVRVKDNCIVLIVRDA